MCNDCPSGLYSSYAGSIVCAPCVAGTFSTGGAAACGDCDAGTTSGAMARACSRCEAGKYTAEAGEAACSDCAGNFYSRPGASACELCLGGFYYSLAGNCELCPSGAVCDADGNATQRRLLLERNMWRISNVSVEVHDCPLRRACVGGDGAGATEGGRGYCGEGFTGPLCAVCDDKFYLNPDERTCTSCSAFKSPGAVIASSPTLVIAVAALW